MSLKQGQSNHEPWPILLSHMCHLKRLANVLVSVSQLSGLRQTSTDWIAVLDHAQTQCELMSPIFTSTLIKIDV